MLYSTVESRKVHGDSRKAQVGPTMFMSLLAECVWDYIFITPLMEMQADYPVPTISLTMLLNLYIMLLNIITYCSILQLLGIQQF